MIIVVVDKKRKDEGKKGEEKDLYIILKI